MGDPTKCTACNGDLRHTEEVVSICARWYDGADCNFQILYEIYESPNMKPSIPRELNFHLKCFESVAGKQYLP